MTATCGGDALICIEFVVLGIGEFVSDWTTLVMLALLLGLLLKLRADRQTTRETGYARRLAAYDEQRHREMQGQTVGVPNDTTAQR